MLTNKIYELILPLIKAKMSLLNNNIVDYAILGSASGHYGWKEVKFCDFDLWIYCRKMSNICFINGINQLIEEIRDLLYKKNILVYAEAINGPYKPSIWHIENKDVLFLHILVDDKNSYISRSIFTKLSWSKYKTFYKQDLLLELLDRIPQKSDLLTSNCGILSTLDSLKKGYISYTCLSLTDGHQETYTFYRNSAQYIEYILHSILTIARNRLRILMMVEADTLNNKSFAQCYSEMFNDKYISIIADYKDKTSNFGFEAVGSIDSIEEIAINWLSNIKDEMENECKNE